MFFKIKKDTQGADGKVKKGKTQCKKEEKENQVWEMSRNKRKKRRGEAKMGRKEKGSSGLFGADLRSLPLDCC